MDYLTKFCKSLNFRLKKSRNISILILLLSSYSVFGQKPDSIFVTKNYQNSSLASFISDIESNYAYKFYYKPEWVEALKITQNFRNTSLHEALELIFKETPYLYELVQNSIILLPREDVAIATGKMEVLVNKSSTISAKTIGFLSDAGKYRKAVITGQIISKKDKSPVIGAVLRILKTQYGATTDKDGMYTVTLPTGIFNLNVTSVGFEESILPIKLISNGTLDIELPEKSIKISEVIISARKANRNVSSNQMSLIQMDRKQIKQLPTQLGSKDILKSMTMIAGVKSVGEFGSDINVRGGGGDQNLYLIEGTPVFNTSHIFGLISVINSDAISNVALYKGDIPAKYGERVSSLMDIEIKKDIPRKIRGYGGLGLIDSRFTIEVPIIKDKLSVLVSGRSTYSDWLLQRMPDINLRTSRASFYDANVAVNYMINPKNTLNVFFYASNDYFRYANEINFSYGNILGSAKWQHIYGDNLFSILSLNISKYAVTKDEIDLTYEKSRTYSDVLYKTAKLNFNYSKFDKHTIEWGLQSIFYTIKPGEINPLDSLSMVAHKQLDAEQANESAIYLSDKFEMNDIFSISAGLRVSVYSFLGPQNVNTYKDDQTRSSYTVTETKSYAKNKIINQFVGIEPRISLKYQISDEKSLKLSYNRNFQYLSLISYTSVFTPNDRWKLSDPFIKPIQCDQVAIGYFANFKRNTVETSVEIYYKNLKNLTEYKNGANINLNPTLETELMPADGKNYGVEIMLKKTRKRLDTWISYTWSRSLKRTVGAFQEEIINENSLYPSNFDKPHELSAFFTFHINRRWRISSNFNFATGRSITLPELKYKIGNAYVVSYSDRNKYRLPNYHRMDLALSYDESIKLKKKWKGSWTLSVMNIYGRHNAFSVFYKKEVPSPLNNYTTFSLNKLYIIGQPIPTLTYNFIF